MSHFCNSETIRLFIRVMKRNVFSWIQDITCTNVYLKRSYNLLVRWINCDEIQYFKRTHRIYNFTVARMCSMDMLRSCMFLQINWHGNESAEKVFMSFPSNFIPDSVMACF